MSKQTSSEGPIADPNLSAPSGTLPGAIPGSIPATVTPSNGSTSLLREAMVEIVVGSVSGVVGKVCEYPFDTVKVRLQYSQSLPQRLYTSTLDCIVKTYKNEGLYNGFYKGLLSPVAGAAVEMSCLFFSYRLAQNAVNSINGHAYGTEVSFTQKLWCGCFSGIMTSFILTPIELVKCRMQVENLKLTEQNAQKSSSIVRMIKSVVQENGLKGLWKGQLTTLAREAGGTTVWFGSYEYVLNHFRGDNGPEYQHKGHEVLLAGAAAGVGYNASFFPVDMVKNVLQTSDVPNSSVSTVVKNIYRAKGLRGFYSGLGVSLCKTFPASAVTFWVYEEMKKCF